MYKDSFALAVLLNGHIAIEKEEKVIVPFESEYGLRLKNKYSTPVAVDIYIDGRLTNEAGHILVTANSHIDIYNWVSKNRTGRKFVFTKVSDRRVEEKNESENGIIEVRFYNPKEEVNVIPTTIYIGDTWPYYPIYPHRPYRIDDWNRWNDYETTPPSPWITCCDNGYDNDGDVGINSRLVDNNVSELFYNENGSEHGATVKGRHCEDLNIKTSGFELEIEPVVLKLKLVGVNAKKPKTMYCIECGRRIKHKDNYCPKCGSMLT